MRVGASRGREAALGQGPSCPTGLQLPFPFFRICLSFLFCPLSHRRCGADPAHLP